MISTPLRLLLAVCIAGVISSCRNEPEKNSSTETESQPDAAPTYTPKTLVLPYTAVINDSTHSMELHRDPAADMTNLEGPDIVEAINLKYPEIPVTWVKHDQGMAYVRIDKANYLTQQAGSEGAQAYLAELTYALTELKGINSVDVQFTAGDHAQPGQYDRKSFRDSRIR